MSQRQPGNTIRSSLDLISLAIGYYGIESTILKIQLPPQLAKAGPWQFLTNISLVLSMIVFAVGFVSHLTKSSKLFNVKNYLNAIALILEIVVAGVYWPLRFFFLHLLVKDPKQFKLTLSGDMSVHLMPVVSLLIDYLFFMPPWKMKPITALLTVLTLSAGYWFHLDRLIDFKSGGIYPYMFLNVDGNAKRAAIFVVISLFAYSQFFVMRKLYAVVNSEKKVSTKKKS